LKVLSVKSEKAVIEEEDGNDIDLGAWIEENAVNECFAFAKLLEQ